jgi:hypothetical protein
MPARTCRPTTSKAGRHIRSEPATSMINPLPVPKTSSSTIHGRGRVRSGRSSLCESARWYAPSIHLQLVHPRLRNLEVGR